jgi:hypothetical protein
VIVAELYHLSVASLNANLTSDLCGFQTVLPLQTVGTKLASRHFKIQNFKHFSTNFKNV